MRRPSSVILKQGLPPAQERFYQVLSDRTGLAPVGSVSARKSFGVLQVKERTTGS